MASFAALRTSAFRLARTRAAVATPPPTLAARSTQRRHLALGGHSGPPPEWEGIDKVVRGVFPQDYQLAMAILGGYTGLYVIYSISSMIGGKKKEDKKEETPAKSSSSSSSTKSEGVPDVESPEFVTFLESDALVKLLENEDELKALTE